MTKKTKKKENKWEKLNFKVEGAWLTWFLRHQWIEGSETKAIHTWCAAFPQFSSVEHLNKYFLPVVTGAKKLEGWNDFELVKDDTKYWNPVAGAEPDKAWPLIQSWDDMFLLKKVKLYFAELELRSFRFNRRYPDSRETADYNGLRFHMGCPENHVENGMRKRASEYYADIRNITYILGTDIKPFPIPSDAPLKSEAGIRMKGVLEPKPPSSVTLNEELYQEVLSVIAPVREYFIKKYGVDMVLIADNEIRAICEISQCEYDSSDLKFNRTETEKRYDRIASKMPPMYGIPSALGFQMPSVDDFIHMQMRESERKLEAEDISETFWNSGYFNPEGEFYGCGDICHKNLATEIVEKFGLKARDTKDPEQILDRLGWVKISMHRFFWDVGNVRLTDQQKAMILEWMTIHKMKTAVLGHYSQTRTFEEAEKEM